MQSHTAVGSYINFLLLSQIITDSVALNNTDVLSFISRGQNSEVGLTELKSKFQ